MNDTERNPADHPLPDGDYCIVELMGHQTLVGRYAEVERFGTKMLALEPVFNGHLLGVVFHGGSAIYRLTPCDKQVAWDRQPRHGYQIPPAILATVPLDALPAPEPAPRYDEDEDDGRPF